VVRPFRGLRPQSNLAKRIASPPYDVLDSDEAREITTQNPLSFLRVVKPEVDLDPSTDLYSESVYQKGAENLRKMIADGTMTQDPKPMFYFYRQVMGQHSQVGLVATVSAEDYEAGRIKKHEFTRPEKERDRVRHIESQGAQCGPVFLTYPDIPELNELQEQWCKSHKPEVNFVADDGVGHTVWLVDNETVIDSIKETFAQTPCLYVADGHHRSAAGAIVAQKQKEANPQHMGDEEYNFFLTVIFPQSHMKIMAYNRVVTDLNGLSKAEFLSRVRKDFTISQGVGPTPRAQHNYSMYLGGQWHGLSPKPGSYPAKDTVASLDVSILQDNLLKPVLGIDDPRTSDRIRFIGGIRGMNELAKLVDSGTFAVAFSLFPTTVGQLMKVADGGRTMPPKSTWFEPKLRSGLVVHLI
jgi:uncharacterized protein (DUF1015 family)